MTAGTETRSESARRWIAALRGSHDRLVLLLSGLDKTDLSAESYCDDWTIAQVLSHLGSGAEIFSLIIEAGLNGESPPGPETFPAIWDSWNAKSPEQQAEDFKGADTALLEQIEGLDTEQLEDFHIGMFGMELESPQLFGMRESELALHSWDIAAKLDPAAHLAPDVTELLVDAVAQRIPRAAKPIGRPLELLIETTDPQRSFLVSLDETATVEVNPPADKTAGSAKLGIPAEAFLRLVAGRLDAEHTPSGITTSGVTLDELRQVFPGF
jgi:uncharacterized protein (TIGR03083 family)